MMPEWHYHRCGNLAGYLHDISTPIPVLFRSRANGVAASMLKVNKGII
jgi:hypothetical protein